MRVKPFGLQAMFVALFLVVAGESGRFDASEHQGKRPQSKCPALEVTCPGLVEVGATPTFSVQITGTDRDVTFNWTVSNGSLSSGQGTRTVKLDTTGLSDGDSVTATVEVGGLAPECSRTASCTLYVKKKPKPRKIDEYGLLKPKEEEARLDHFGIALLSEPGVQGYIIAYGATISAGRKAADKVKGLLVDRRGIDASRLVTVGGARKQAMIELFIVPLGAEPPRATSTVGPSKAKPASRAKPKKP